jgi:hypothetical protein
MVETRHLTDPTGVTSRLGGHTRNQFGSVSRCSRACNFFSLVPCSSTRLRNRAITADTRDRAAISVQPNSSAASIKRRSAVSRAPARSSGGNPQIISAILGIVATADFRKAFSSSAGAMTVNAQLIGQLQVVHRRYRVERVGVLEVYGKIPRASKHPLVDDLCR